MNRVLAVVMVSLNHEGVLELVRDRPAFAADLLGDLLDVKVPPFREARRVDVTLTQVTPAEYRADAVVLFTKKKPVFGVIIEAQLRPKNEKRYTWPLYAVGARARERCPFVVLVVAPTRQPRGGRLDRSSSAAATSTRHWWWGPMVCQS